MKITCVVVVLLIETLRCYAADDSPFQLTNTATGFCLVKTNNNCNEIRWTTGDRLLVPQRKKCLGVQGKSVGSEISLYDCDENSELQKWHCKNETVLALKDQELYLELTADNTAVLSRTIGPNNHLTISGTTSGACTRTYRELYAIAGNAAGMPCMFPFQYEDQWYTECFTVGSPEKRLWCAVETKYQNERWGYCPVTSRVGWHRHPITGAYYQLNTQAALTWPQAETSCKQQGASLLSINDPHEQAYVMALLGTGGNKVWTGLILDPKHGWKWSNGRPYRYMKWDSGHPLPDPGHNCGVFDPAAQYSWQSSLCSKKLGYICSSKAADELPTQAAVTGFCSSSWIPYNGHCFHLNRTQRTWSDAQRECRNQGGDLVTIRNVEDQSFVISQLGYTSTDELWIGLNDRKTEGLFDWIDHSTVTFTSWEYGKPSTFTETKDCILIRGENGNWADRVCEEKHGSICMKMSASKRTGDELKQDEGCKAGWRRHGSYCYFIGTQSKTFDEAKDHCQRSDSYLADVSNVVDNAFLVSLVGLRPEKHFWLGLSNQKNIDVFVWTNNNPVKFTHWNTAMPGHRQGCVAMTSGIFAGLWDLLPCTKRVQYICKHMAEGAILTPAPPTAFSLMCANGWTPLGSRHYCFKLFSDSSNHRTWYEARDYCRGIGGDLLSLHSTEEQQLLPENYDTVWIGLSAPDPANGYVWSDESAVNFQHWEDGEPNNKNNVESCAEIKLHRRDRRGSWNDVHCEMFHGWLCQIRSGKTPKPPPDRALPDYNTTSDGWLDWKGTQYYFNRRSMAMEDARRFCQERHSDLVTIDSEAESVFLWKQIVRSYGSYWIGLNVDLDSTYSWTDGSPVVFQRWDENQPRFLNNDENCAYMTSSMGFWHNHGCGFEFKSICKRSGSPPVNATVPPLVRSGGCPQSWTKFGFMCYKVINNQNETWEGAKTQCKAMGGNLASVISREVQVFLTTKLLEAPTTDLWIGFHNSNGNPFYWTDGQPARYSNWGSQRDYVDPFERDHHFYMRYEMDYDVPSPIMMIRRWKECAAMSPNPKTGIGKWIKKSCNDTTGYICHRNIDPSFPESPEPTTTHTDYIKILNDSIKVITQPMSWEAAKKHCERDGAKLASLRNEWSHVYVELMAMKLKAHMWIGLNKMETGGYFRYIDGWRMTITKWGRREPSKDKPCVYVDLEGKWRTDECYQNKSSICMKSTEVAPTDSTDFPGFCPDDPETLFRRDSYSWLPYRGNCYLFLTDRVEWPDASANCIRHGGALASIGDPFEQEFIETNIKMFQDSQSSFWIGLYKTHKGMWLWLDKTVMDYNNWDMGQPSDNSYASIKTLSGKWSTGNRWYDRPYICKTAKILGNAPPTAGSSVADVQTRGHALLAALLIITGIAIGTAIIFFLFKKSGRRLHIPERLTTFDNPLFFNNERSQPNLVDTNKLVANAEEENPENPAPVVTV